MKKFYKENNIIKFITDFSLLIICLNLLITIITHDIGFIIIPTCFLLINYIVFFVIAVVFREMKL